MEITTCLWIFVILLSATIIALSLVYCAAIFCRHRAHKKRDIALFEKNNGLPPEVRNTCISVIERRYSTIQNYFIFQTINKVFGFTGVLYSILGFGVGLIDIPPDANAASMKYLCAAISLVSIIAVIIALYMSPTRRIAEYINAWRLYDKKVSEMTGKIFAHKRTTPNHKTIRLIPVDIFMNHKIKTEDFVSELSSFVFEVESSIDSECE